MTEEEAVHLRALGIIKKNLSKFDLSKNEVRVFLFLARFGPQKAQRISEAIGVHRTEAYKILHRLERQGLISCVFERPMKFVAVPFEAALENLIEERRHRISMMERRKKELLSIWQSLPKPEEQKTSNETFQVLEGKRQISVKANEMLDVCKTELLVMFSDSNLLWLYNTPFFEELDRVSRKNAIDARIISNYSPTSEYVFDQANLSDSDFAYCGVEGAPSFVISDDNQILLLMENGRDLEDKMYAMWTNHGSVVKSLKLLFSLLWKK